MKRLLLLSLVCFLFTNCADFLDRRNPENLAEDFFTKGEVEAEKVVNAAYSVMQKNAMYMRGIQIINTLRSDEGSITPNTSKMEEDAVSLATYQNNASEQLTAMLWRELYDGIHKSNVAIQKIPLMNLTEMARDRMLGEAYFLRGFYNWHLVMYFGEEVPLRKIPASSQSDLERTPAKHGELWMLIISDFQSSKEHFIKANYKNNSESYKKGRACLGAAVGYLGKSYLYYAQMKGDQSFYQKAASEFAEIIKGEVGSYVLMNCYKTNFTNEQEYNQESLFEVGFSFSGTKIWEVDQDNSDCVEMNWVSMIGGMTSNCGKDSPRYWNFAPTRRLLRQYEVGDYRLIYTLWAEQGAWYKDKDAVYVYNADVVPGKQSMSFPNNPFTKGENGLYVGFRKYDYDFNPTTAEYVGKALNGLSDINIRTLRYADILLMYAECLAYGAADIAGKSATDCLKEIRKRANNKIASSEDSYQYTNCNSALPYFVTFGLLPDSYPADLKTQIQHERMVELAGESHRYFDIIRWYTAGELLDIDRDSPSYGARITTVGDLKSKVILEPAFRGVFVLPIPQYELNTNRNMKPNAAN